MTEDKRMDQEPAKKAVDLADVLGNALGTAGGTEAATASAIGAFADLGRYGSIQDRMNSVMGIAGIGSTLSGVAEQIAQQQRALESMEHIPSLENHRYDFNSLGSFEPPHVPEPLRIPELHIPPNPIHETNNRLERIEERFEQMQDVATDAAKIVTGLQASAAEFLVKFDTGLAKFESAASSNDKTSHRVLWIGVIAIAAAVAMPLLQIIYSAYTAEPDSAPEFRAAILKMQEELVALRQSQADASDRLTDALAASDQDTASVLRDIHDLLSAPPASSPSTP